MVEKRDDGSGSMVRLQVEATNDTARMGGLGWIQAAEPVTERHRGPG